MGRPGVVIAALLVVAATTTATTGVSSVTASRSVSADSVSDETAYLGVEPTDVTVTSNRTNATLVRVSNGLGERVTVRVDVFVADGPVGPVGVDAPESLAAGEQGRVTLDLRCDTEGTTTARVELTVEGATTGVSLTRTVRIECA